jgi:O-antigen/teichoic acid export membrane protein
MFLKRSRAALNLFDFLALLSSRSVAQLLTIVTGLLLVRIMAESAFGAYSLATTSIGLAGVVADFGLDTILTREIATDRNRTTLLVRSVMSLRTVLALLTTSAMVGLALLTAAAGRADLLLIGGLSLAPRSILRTITSALTGLGRVRETALVEGITVAASALATIFLVIVGGDDKAAGAIWGLLVGNAIGVIAGIWIGRLPLRNSDVGAGYIRLSLLRAALPFLIANLAGTAFLSLDIYVVKSLYSTGQVFGKDPVALYAAPYRVLNVLLLVPTAWGIVLLPRYVRYARRPAAIRLALRRDVSLGLAMGIALSATCTILSYPITLITLGQSYATSAPVLAVISWMTLPVCLYTPILATLIARGRQTWIAISALLAGAAAIAANILLSTSLNIAATHNPSDLTSGLIAVAAVKVASIVLLAILYWFALPRK